MKCNFTCDVLLFLERKNAVQIAKKTCAIYGNDAIVGSLGSEVKILFWETKNILAALHLLVMTKSKC